MLNNNNSYYLKYLKYKTKYSSLKKQTLKGGMGSSNSKYWNINPLFEKINNNNKFNLIINNEYNNISQYQNYKPLLNTLLNKENYLINLDFINKFYRNIYYDNDGIYGIRDISGVGLDASQRNNFNWINQENTLWLITESYIKENAIILFLQHKDDLRNQKVLKIYNTLPVDIDSINDYLSLEISQIGGIKSGMFTQRNYNYYNSMDEFNLNNFNMVDHTIPGVIDGERIYLSCRNNNAINDYIINIIIRNIKETLRKNINIINYDNIFVTQFIDGSGRINYYYCIIMDKMDGSFDNLLKLYHKKSEPEIIENIHNMLTQTENNLKILKQNDYLFTHTDLKIENIFYKIVNNNLVIYLGDFDKSSITYHNIRFYNDIRKTPEHSSLLASQMDPLQGIATLLRTDDYTFRSYPDRKVASRVNSIFSYRISRFGRVNIVSSNIETEQLYMRYYNNPYYTSFDIISLLLSLMHYRYEAKALFNLDRISQNKIYIFMTRYMTSDTAKLLITIYSSIITNYNGNFGLIIKPILERPLAELKNINFLHQFNNEPPNIFINKLYLTYNNKIALSLPYVPTNIRVNDALNNFAPNIDATNKWYTKLFSSESSLQIIKDIKDRFITDIRGPNSDKYIIEYSGDYSLAKERGARYAFMKTSLPEYIIITNRYSYRDVLSCSTGCVYEWDHLKDPSHLILLLNANKEEVEEFYDTSSVSGATGATGIS